jgi:opacity protein-like surface antigen
MISGDDRMKTSIAAVLVWTALATAAHAQSSGGTAPAAPTTGYAEVVAQSAFGNVTSQSFGGEVGIAVRPGIQVFVDAGKIRDAAAATVGASAQNIAAGIAAAAGSADFRVRQPVTFGVAGVKYLVRASGTRAEPYVLVGGGVANVKRDVAFSTPAGDVNQFVTLGSDLSGSETKGMLSLGAGVGVPVWRAVIIDLQYRYGRIFTSGGGLNVNRAGIGIGVRF